MSDREPPLADRTLVDSLDLAVGGRQVIPRPPGAYLGAPAPWELLAPAHRRGLDLPTVRGALPHPGRAQAAPAATVDGLPDPGAPSAVLVALFEEGGETRVVLTRRAAHLRSHQGEVSFPGGRLDDGEEPEAGALREASEEVGLDPGAVTVLGRLTPLATFTSRSAITPVVGVLGDRPRLDPNPSEVDHCFDVALAELAAPGVFREERWTRLQRPVSAHLRAQLGPDGSYPVWFFELPDDTVWGATARVLVELLRRVLQV